MSSITGVVGEFRSAADGVLGNAFTRASTSTQVATLMVSMAAPAIAAENTPVPFDTETTVEGFVRSAAGVFTVLFSGLYLVSAQIGVGPEAPFGVWNGSAYIMSFLSAPDFASVGGTAIVYLSAGQQISVRATAAAALPVLGNLNNAPLSWFCATRLAQV